jgi:hypothetical protein
MSCRGSVCSRGRGRSQHSDGRQLFVAMCVVVGWLFAVSSSSAESPLPPDLAFLTAHCAECHSGDTAEAGLELTKLPADLQDPAVERRWVQILDRVTTGDMPPADFAQPSPVDRDRFVQSTSAWVRQSQRDRAGSVGRVRTRRLTARETERSLQDLLGIDIPLADQLPEEPRAAGSFSTVADGQPMSHFQLERHLAVVDKALDEAFRRALSPSDLDERHCDARQIVRDDPRRRCREPELLNDRAVVWNGNVIFYGRIPTTTAREEGWYHFTVRVSALNPPKDGGVWTTVRTGRCVSSAPLLTLVHAFEASAEPRDVEFTAWLPEDHMLEIHPGDANLKKARFEGGQIGAGEGEPQHVPGIAIDEITINRIHLGPDDDAIRRILFGDLLRDFHAETGKAKFASGDHRESATRVLADFARRAFRRPVTDDELAPYVALVHAALDEEAGLKAALRVGYRAILCSPRFLYLTESPGPLDDHAIAARLSYFLTGSLPDAELSALADGGRLHDRATLRAQADRLLAGPGGRRFVQDIAAEWLDLDLINFTEPDRKLYPDFDPVVQKSMLDETHAFLETMLDENQPVSRLIRAEDTFLNSRLARFYEIDGVDGDELQRVSLGPESHRGGLLTQGAILKVTANGSNTSPVVRGVWVSERLLGVEIPPPPDSVPAIEPDIRGATTIREQLAKHREQESCAVCHVKIDPPGFALENFDPAGQWRERYVRDGKRDRGARVDPSYTLPDGREFDDVTEFQKLVCADPRRLAVNVTGKLLVYGTGAEVSFADRAAVDEIVDAAASGEYGLRSLVHGVVTSPVFLSK